MKIIPAIDIFNGRCVRLLKGDYAKVSEYNQCPIDQVKIFKNAGFDYIHIIDLNAAKSGGNENLEIIKEICKLDNINIQVGGGIRTIKKINNLFAFGVDRVIVGTAAIIDDKFKEDIKNYIDLNKVIYGLDFKTKNNIPFLAVNGWTENTSIKLFDYINMNPWIKNILATDISVDGTLLGPNINIYKKILKDKKINLIASGGIGLIDDIYKLKKISANECVVGKAIYENKIPLEDLKNVN